MDCGILHNGFGVSRWSLTCKGQVWRIMIYIPEESKVIYQSKDGKDEKVFDALEWIAAMVSHPPALPEIHSHWTEMLDREIRQASARDRRQPWRAGVPNKGEQMVRYYGYYSNVSRGKRKKGTAMN